jgi:hypothetical protein
MGAASLDVYSSERRALAAADADAYQVPSNSTAERCAEGANDFGAQSTSVVTLMSSSLWMCSMK